MGRNFMRIFIMVVSIISLLCGLCYADEIDPWFEYKKQSIPSSVGQQSEIVNIIPMIIIGITIVVIVAVSVIVLVKSKDDKNKENESYSSKI